MNVQLRFNKTKVSASVKSYLQEKIDRLEKYVPKTTILEVELRNETRSRKGRNKVINYTVDIPGEKKAIHIAKASYDFRSVIDIASKKLEKTLQRYHGKKIKKVKKESIIKRTIKAAGYLPGLLVRKPKVLKTNYKNTYSGKAIYPDQAIERFKNQKEPFIVFKNIENNKISIITKIKNKIIIYTIVS